MKNVKASLVVLTLVFSTTLCLSGCKLGDDSHMSDYSFLNFMSGAAESEEV